MASNQISETMTMDSLNSLFYDPTKKKKIFIIDQLIPSKILISSNFAQENLIPPKRNILCDEYVSAKLDKRRESKIAPFQ